MVIEDCPYQASAEELLRAALAATPGAGGYLMTVLAAGDVIPAEFGGSPTFLVNGRDAFEGGHASFSCRRYFHPDGIAVGVPEAMGLRTALEQATSTDSECGRP